MIELLTTIYTLDWALVWPVVKCVMYKICAVIIYRYTGCFGAVLYDSLAKQASCNIRLIGRDGQTITRFLSWLMASRLPAIGIDFFGQLIGSSDFGLMTLFQLKLIIFAIVKPSLRESIGFCFNCFHPSKLRLNSGKISDLSEAIQ